MKQIPAWVSVALLAIQFATGFVAYGRLEGKIDALESTMRIILAKEIGESSRSSR